MSTHRYFDAICVVVLVLTLLITVLFMNGKAYGIQVIVDEDAEAYGHAVLFTENDKNGAWDTARATRITLDGDEVSVFGICSLREYGIRDSKADSSLHCT